MHVDMLHIHIKILLQKISFIPYIFNQRFIQLLSAFLSILLRVMMDSLIDLATPSKVTQTYSQDFTPTLSRALAECFRKRAESNSCEVGQESNKKLSGIKSIVNFRSENENFIDNTELEPLDFSSFDNSLADPEPILNLHTPTSHLPTPENWKDMLIDTPMYSKMYNDSPKYFSGFIKDDASQVKHETPVTCSSRKHLSAKNKRGPSSPICSSFITPMKTKRRALEVVSTNTPSLKSKPNYLWSVDNNTYALEEMERDSATINMTPTIASTNTAIPITSITTPTVTTSTPTPIPTPTTTIPGSPVQTPASIKNLRKIVGRPPHQGGGKHKFHPLRNELFFYHSTETQQTLSIESYELDVTEVRAKESECKYFQPEFTKPSYSSTSPRHVTCVTVGTDPELQSWLIDEKVKDLEAVVRFMELEKKFNI